MPDYQYTGHEAFGDDVGTFWPAPGASFASLQLTGSDGATVKRDLKRTSSSMPIVWFVDDERANREWFRDYHREHFGVVTFSSRQHFRRSLNRGFPCDAIVTDVFFPAEPVRTDEHAQQLLSIYEKMKSRCVDELPSLWSEERYLWKLDGFTVARDAVQREPPIPVFLFSRKATLLLSVDDYMGEPPAVANSYWLLEKVNPTADAATARRAADIQRDRIISVVGVRKSRWRSLLRSLSVGSTGVTVNMEKLVQ
ncbi:MAG: hypothetical protein KAY37_01390 [Phycisphaerae bacterium]|nr:hypothetical protein [Phycisphaerae bacterium]